MKRGPLALPGEIWHRQNGNQGREELGHAVRDDTEGPRGNPLATGCRMVG
jgi:hypothetical protein